MYQSFTYFYFFIAIVFGIYFYALDIPLIESSDEILAILLLIFYAVNRHYKMKEFRIFGFIILFYAIYSVYLSITNVNAIAMDIVIQTKSFIVFYCTVALGLRLSDKGKRNIKQLILALSLVTLVALVVDYDFVMYDLFGHPSRYGGFFTLAGFAYYYCSDRSSKALRTTILLWTCMLACMKSKSIGFFVIAFFLTVNIKSLAKSLRFNFKTVFVILIGALLSIAFVWERFKTFYIANGIEADAVEDMYACPALYYTAMEIMKDYLPFGSGFGTFASYASGLYYSRLYYDYGISNVFGLQPDAYNFVSDTYFPVLAQFGIVGLCLFTMFMWKRVKGYWRMYKSDGEKQMMLMKFLILIYLLIESTSDSTIIQNRGVVMMFILGLYHNDSLRRYRLLTNWKLTKF